MAQIYIYMYNTDFPSMGSCNSFNNFISESFVENNQGFFTSTMAIKLSEKCNLKLFVYMRN